MWKALYCYLTGQHEYAVTCEPGHIFLRCRACGKQSNGWGLNGQAPQRTTSPAVAPIRMPRRRDAHAVAQRRAA
jgi:hypothetical protein